MKIDDYTKISHKRYSNLNNYDDNKKIKYLKFLITRVLISIIIVICVSIYIKLGPDNAYLVNEYLFQDNLQFTKINQWYHDKFGSVIPSVGGSSELVFSNDIKSNPYEEYLDGVKIKMNKQSPISLLYGGIVVFMGEKEDYGYTVIVQGNDGIDYWYGGLNNVSINLYDYLEKDTLIGDTLNDYFYLVLMQNGQYLSYEEYLK